MDFDTAVARSKECKSATNDDKLALYKFFKQVRCTSSYGCLPLAPHLGLHWHLPCSSARRLCLTPGPPLPPHPTPTSLAGDCWRLQH